MLVLAGPGSGKTTVIAERVRYLIEESNVRPEEILTITFTKAAALEMQQRCIQRCPRAGNAVFGTFHSVFYQFLRKSEKYQKYSILSENEKYQIMRKLIPCENMTALQHEYVCKCMLKKISFYKNSGAEVPDEQDKAIMNRYCNLCGEQEKLDFDDMLLLCKRMFEQFPAELKKWQNYFSYILVDEFQDINSCQYEVLKLLAEQHGNLFVVGDDDQAIYSFRGSDPGIMKRFVSEYPGCRQVFLSENYRCGASIVSLAGNSIAQNVKRFEKNICAVKNTADYVTLKQYNSREEEMTAILTSIEAKKQCLTAAGEAGDKIAVLVRTNAQLEYLAEEFYRRKIPCNIREKRYCFYEQSAVQDVLAILRFSVCGQKRSDFFQFMNKPFRGLERAVFADETVDLKKSAAIEASRGNRETAAQLKSMERYVGLIRRLDPYGAVKLALAGMKYEAYALERCGDKGELGEQIRQQFEELAERAGEFDSISDFLCHVKEYTRQFHAERKAQALSEKAGPIAEGNVFIMTYHASKGLEFERVYLPMLCGGTVPHGRMLTQDETEEERRMFYVAMTRAEKELLLSWHDNNPSLFLTELGLEKAEEERYHREDKVSEGKEIKQMLLGE